jgi:hypothetical protein
MAVGLWLAMIVLGFLGWPLKPIWAKYSGLKRQQKVWFIVSLVAYAAALIVLTILLLAADNRELVGPLFIPTFLLLVFATSFGRDVVRLIRRALGARPHTR